MMKKSLALIALGALLCGSLASAQGGGQGRGGGFRMMRGGAGGGSLSMLAGREDVQKELAITSEQRSKLREMAEARRERMQARMQEMRDGGGEMPDRATMEKQMREFEAQNLKELTSVLNEGQMKRLRELSIQRSGIMAVMNPDVQKEIGFTDAQKAKLDDLQAKQQEAMQAIFEKMRNQEIDREEMRPLMEKNRKIMDEEVGKLLSQAQKDKLRAMSGAPFKFDEDEDRPRFDG